MKTSRSLFWLALAGALALAGSPAAAQTKWNLPAAYPADNPHSENLAAFAKDVEAATGGVFYKVTAQYAGGETDGSVEVLATLSATTQQIVLTWTPPPTAICRSTSGT